MLSLTLTVALTVTLSAVAVSPSAAAPKKGTALAKKPKLAQAGHATFWDCPSKTTELLVVVNTLTLHPGATLTVSFTVRNGGTTSCNYTAPYASVAPGPTSTSLTAGPCGSVGYQIENSHHHNVWPGAQVVNESFFNECFSPGNITRRASALLACCRARNCVQAW